MLLEQFTTIGRRFELSAPLDLGGGDKLVVRGEHGYSRSQADDERHDQRAWLA